MRDARHMQLLLSGSRKRFEFRPTAKVSEVLAFVYKEWPEGELDSEREGQQSLECPPCLELRFFFVRFNRLGGEEARTTLSITIVSSRIQRIITSPPLLSFHSRTQLSLTRIIPSKSDYIADNSCRKRPR